MSRSGWATTAVAQCLDSSLHSYRDLLPVAECSPVLADELGLSDDVEGLPASTLEALAKDAARLPSRMVARSAEPTAPNPACL